MRSLRFCVWTGFFSLYLQPLLVQKSQYLLWFILNVNNNTYRFSHHPIYHSLDSNNSQYRSQFLLQSSMLANVLVHEHIHPPGPHSGNNGKNHSIAQSAHLAEPFYLLHERSQLHPLGSQGETLVSRTDWIQTMGFLTVNYFMTFPVILFHFPQNERNREPILTGWNKLLINPTCDFFF